MYPFKKACIVYIVKAINLWDLYYFRQNPYRTFEFRIFLSLQPMENCEQNLNEVFVIRPAIGSYMSLHANFQCP